MIHNFVKTALAASICSTTVAAGWVAAEAPQLTRTRQRLEAGDAVTIVCLGDSVTGVYYHTGGRRSYPELLEETLHKTFRASKVRVINAGVSGNRTSDGLARLRNDVLQFKPDLVVVKFGLNDMEGLPVERFTENLKELATQIQAAGAEILFCTPNDVIDSPVRRRGELVNYVAAIRNFCSLNSLPLADIFAAFESLRASGDADFRFEMNDEIHPNLDGHRRIAAMLAKTIAGKSLSSDDTPPGSDPHLSIKQKHRQPIRILTVLPEDVTISAALKKQWPDATIVSLAKRRSSLEQVTQDAVRVRANKPDLVLVGLPYRSLAGSDERVFREFNKLLNLCFTGGQQEWDVIVIPPSIFTPPQDEDNRRQDGIVRRIMRARDLPMIERQPGDPRSASEIIADWLAAHRNLN